MAPHQDALVKPLKAIFLPSPVPSLIRSKYGTLVRARTSLSNCGRRSGLSISSSTPIKPAPNCSCVHILISGAQSLLTTYDGDIITPTSPADTYWKLCTA